jgi:hypothetical protein
MGQGALAAAAPRPLSRRAETETLGAAGLRQCGKEELVPQLHGANQPVDLDPVTQRISHAAERQFSRNANFGHLSPTPGGVDALDPVSHCCPSYSIDTSLWHNTLTGRRHCLKRRCSGDR